MALTYINRGHFYAPHTFPVLLDCNFVVDSANGNGLGIRSLKGQGIANVFMHTTATPGVGNQGQLNPNPPSGTIAVQLNDNYNRLYALNGGFASPVSGTPLTSVTANTPYVIVSVGTTTQAQWAALGLPFGVIPAVGAAFIASSTTAITGTGAVEAIAATASGCDHIELLGDPNQTLSPVPTGGSPTVGGWLFCNTYLNTTKTAPADGTVVGLQFYLSKSSTAVAGE
jgi:hypothetical protein